VIFDFVKHHQLKASKTYTQITLDQWNKSYEHTQFDDQFRAWTNPGKPDSVEQMPKDL